MAGPPSSRRSPSRRPRGAPGFPIVAPLSLLLAPALLLFAAPLSAQGTAPLQGLVVNEQTGEPVAGASVYLPVENIGFLTRADGRFRIPDLPVGTHELQLRRIGYAERTLQVTLETEGAPLRLALEPDPVLLEGFEVVVDRFKARRRAVGSRIRVLEEAHLLSSPAFDVAELVARRMGADFVRCPQNPLNWCARGRGRTMPVTVYVDEAPVMGGLEHLSTFQPHELFLLEVYDGGRQVRAYTHRFMERAARTRLSPVPIL